LPVLAWPAARTAGAGAVVEFAGFGRGVELAAGWLAGLGGFSGVAGAVWAGLAGSCGPAVGCAANTAGRICCKANTTTTIAKHFASMASI
jgi:hypothetical protein